MVIKEEELEALAKEWNIKVEILSPGIAIGAIETVVDRCVSRRYIDPIQNYPIHGDNYSKSRGKGKR